MTTEGILFDSQGAADQFIRRRVCARCYEDLRRKPIENRQWVVYCPTCLDAWGSATVARSTAERRGQQAMIELNEVEHNLRDVIPNPNAGKSQKQLLKELGY